MLLLPLALFFGRATGYAQSGASSAPVLDLTVFPKPLDAIQQGTAENPKPPQQATPSSSSDQKQQNKSGEPPKALPPAQPPRVLGIMPNFRAVSAGVIPPPPTPKQALVIATRDSFDYSAFIFVGITSLLAEATNTHPPLGKGVPGFGRYYWRGFADKTDGNYLVVFAFPTILHQDERYYSLGRGSVLKRMIYAASRVVITPNYQGQCRFNASELLGRGVAQAVSLAYYPPQTRTIGGYTSKLGYAIGRDALANAFREFWPDIDRRVLHRRP